MIQQHCQKDKFHSDVITSVMLFKMKLDFIKFALNSLQCYTGMYPVTFWCFCNSLVSHVGVVTLYCKM